MNKPCSPKKFEKAFIVQFSPKAEQRAEICVPVICLGMQSRGRVKDRAWHRGEGELVPGCSVSVALLHLTAALSYRILEELWNLVWGSKGENIYPLTSVPYWSRVAPQALTLLHFRDQQVSTGFRRGPIQDSREAQGRSQASVVQILAEALAGCTCTKLNKLLEQD